MFAKVMAAARRRGNETAGFSLIEMLMVVTIAGILGGMVVGVSSAFINRSKADGTVVALTRTLDIARNRAIAERRNFEITFPSTNRILVQRVEFAVPPAVAVKTTVADVTLENGLTFQKFAAVPDTPDAFGAGSATDFDGTAPVMFTSDGSLVDSAGDVSNGTIFIARETDQTTQRAVTLFGVTGLIRSWKWAGTAWSE